MCFKTKYSTTMSVNSKMILRPTIKFGIFILLVFPLFFCGCSTKYKRIELIEGMYYPNGNVQLDGRRVESPNDNYNLSISQPFRVKELGNITLSFFNLENRREYEKTGGGFASFDVGISDIPGLGEYYIPVYMLNKTGRFEYHTRKLSFTEWTQDKPFLSIFLLIILVILVILIAKYLLKKIQQSQFQKDKEVEQRLKKIREEQFLLDPKKTEQ
jgi:hypothetical protein